MPPRRISGGLDLEESDSVGERQPGWYRNQSRPERKKRKEKSEKKRMEKSKKDEREGKRGSKW